MNFDTIMRIQCESNKKKIHLVKISFNKSTVTWYLHMVISIFYTFISERWKLKGEVKTCKKNQPKTIKILQISLPLLCQIRQNIKTRRKKVMIITMTNQDFCGEYFTPKTRNRWQTWSAAFYLSYKSLKEY